MPDYTCLWPPFVGIVAKVVERHETASPSHVIMRAQMSHAVRAGSAVQAEYFNDVRTMPD